MINTEVASVSRRRQPNSYLPSLHPIEFAACRGKLATDLCVLTGVRAVDR